MKRCDQRVDIGRRWFLSGAGVAVAGAAAATAMPQKAEAAAPLARVAYPSNRLANLGDLKPNTPLEVSYPDAKAPGVLLKLGAKAPGGVGPEGDIVGFTTVCPHKGFPLSYNSSDKSMNCPGHYSRASTVRTEASRFGAKPRKICRNTCSASTPKATSTPTASMNCCTAGCRTCWRAEP